MYGNILASNLIVSRTTVRRDIVNKSTCIQDSIKDALIDPAKYGAFSLVADLRTDDVASQSYQDVIFFWVEESGMNKRIWSLRHAMYAYKYFPKSKKQQIISKLLLIEYYLKLILTQHKHLTQQTRGPICWQLQVSNVPSPVLVTVCLLPLTLLEKQQLKKVMNCL